MNKFKHIFAIFIVLGILSSLAYFFPKTEWGKTLLSNFDSYENTPADTLVVQDTTPFIDRFKLNLEVLQEKVKKNKTYWTLGKGRTIIYYLMHAQQFLESNGGKVLYMEELYDNRNFFQSAKLDALAPNGDTLHLILDVSENIFRDNASYLSIGFQVTKLSPELIVALNSLDFPYDLLVTPFGMSKEFFPDLDRIKNKELVLWLLMESNSLDSRHNKLRPIRIHHTEEQIESIISDAKTLVPSAKGIATRFADQAVEHKHLLQATFAPAKNQKLWFADLSQNNKSKVLDECKESGLACKTLTPYNPSNQSLDDYIRYKLKRAARNGISTLIIPLTEENVEKMKSIKDKAINQGTTIVNLSTFMAY